MTIEELTKEELIELVRRLNPELDEQAVLYDALMSRFDVAREKSGEANKRGWTANEQIRELIQPFADGPIKTGVRLRPLPKTVREQYDKLDQERREAWKERDMWNEQSSEAIRKLGDLQKNKLSRWFGDAF